MNWYAMRVAPGRSTAAVSALQAAIGETSGRAEVVSRDEFVVVPLNEEPDDTMLLKLNRVRANFSDAPGAVLTNDQKDGLLRGDIVLPVSAEGLPSFRVSILGAVIFLLALLVLGFLWLKRSP